MNPARTSRIVRFGVYEADFRAGELRKNGMKLKLQGQPVQVLELLVERAGDVVTRDELRQKLWSDDTFVDFDHSLNAAINKLRDALGDSASNPRFIETLARRGYRFIAPVQVEGGETPVAAPAPESAPALPSEVVLAAPAAEGELPRPHRGLTRALFVLVQIMYLIFYVVALAQIHAIKWIVELWHDGLGTPVFGLVMVTASVGIALRLYLLTASAFDYRQLGRNFHRMFPFILPLDQLWALSPFLVAPQIGFGAAFAATAALLYLPFSERTLIRMAYEY